MVAGPNGAGKTTLTRHLLANGVDLGEYINPDEIAAELSGTLAERTREAQAIADSRRDACIRAKRSFSFETVMSHPSKVDILVRAKEADYTVLLYFVGTDDPQTNVERVALRVAQGGHAVPEDKVRERWLRTMNLLQQAIRSSDRSYIFDNSTIGTINTVPRLVYHRSATRSGRLPQSEQIGVPPAWLKRFVLDPIGTNPFDSYANFRSKPDVGSVVTLPLEIKADRSTPGAIATLVQADHSPIPHSIEAEQRVLGAVIANSEALPDLLGSLEPRHFFEPIHQVILQAAVSLAQAGERITLEAVGKSVPVDADLGGLTVGQYLNVLETEAVTLAEARENARIVFELSLRRELIRLGENIVSAACDERVDSSPMTQIEQARLELDRLTEARSNDAREPALPFQPPLTQGLHQFSRALVGALDSAARAFVRTGPGLKTGFVDVDRKIVGLQPSELIVLASRPGIGKSALATNIAYNVARSWRTEVREDGSKTTVDGGVVGLFSLEMSSEQIATRVISQQGRIPIGVIRGGAISEKEFEIIRDQAIEFQALPFFIDETTALSIEQLAARAHRLKSQKGLDLLIIDNLELLRVAARTNFGESRSRSLQVTRELKKLAKDLAIPILVLAQLPSKVERRRDKRPRLEEFNDRGAIEQDADVIMFLHRDDYYLAQEEPPPDSYEYSKWVSEMELSFGLAELIVAKQRNGATGTINLMFEANIGSFSDLAT
ncbi:hypothetical protein LMTR13_35390 [Bradyrhizobium icense]|uniref:DNA 5'-3' helicase n=2 Tax=Bradyrhizobium icense TaxID=1274631 RepID=A0A1B1UPI2_9BRAD|nr:hypothetical protein LMTR13_35390 [Bradyrhizobium icense]